MKTTLYTNYMRFIAFYRESENGLIVIVRKYNKLIIMTDTHTKFSLYTPQTCDFQSRGF